jgi:hypothetical protein
MSTYTIVVRPEIGDMETIMDRIEHIELLMDKLADVGVLPIIYDNYQKSGIINHSYVLKAGITNRQARGNYVIPSKQGLIVGVDYQQIPYARWVIEGRRGFTMKKKVLRFVIDGKTVFARRVGPAPPHPIYYLTMKDITDLETKLGEMISE